MQLAVWVVEKLEKRKVFQNTYFFTQRLRDPTSDVLVSYVDILRQSVKLARKRYPFEIRAAVILPATLHMIWELPAGDRDHAMRWRMIKSIFSRHLPEVATPEQTKAMKRRGEKGIWTRGGWDHQIRDQADYDLHEHLIIHAPVTSGLVPTPKDWALSSLHLRGARPAILRGPAPMGALRPLRQGATAF